MSADYTPGPWSHDRTLICDSRGLFLADCDSCVVGKDRQLANARLIAAAPEMAEMTRALVVDPRTPYDILNIARALLARIEGDE